MHMRHDLSCRLQGNGTRVSAMVLHFLFPEDPAHCDSDARYSSSSAGAGTISPDACRRRFLCAFKAGIIFFELTERAVTGGIIIEERTGEGTGMIRLIAAEETDRELLWNINQKYLYEMTNFYDDPMDKDGNYHYGTFEAYFTDPKRIAYLLYEDTALIGFAMIHPYSLIGRSPDHTMAEFTIFPVYRKKHLAFAAAAALLKQHPGQWEIKYNEKNTAAKRLWNRIAAPFQPEVISFSDTETILFFHTDRE